MDAKELLSAKDDIRVIRARYTRYADEKRWSELASLFLTDASFTALRPDGATIAEMTDRDQIERTLSAVGVGDVTLIHQVFTGEIEICTPSSARAVWPMADIILRHADDATTEMDADLPQFNAMRGWGHYHDEYRKVDGSWRISNCRQTRTRLEFD